MNNWKHLSSVAVLAIGLSGYGAFAFRTPITEREFVLAA